MSHRVIQFQAKVTSASHADKLKKEIQSKLDSQGYDLFERSVVDGQDTQGNATVSCTTEHNLTDEANSFSTWLKSWMDTNQAGFNSDGSVSTEGLTWVRHKVHDCWHNVQDQQEPCMVQDYKTFDVRPGDS